MKKDKQEFIDYTKQVWQPYYKEELSDSDAVEIIDNMTAYMNLLIKWKRTREQKETCKISYIAEKIGDKENV